MENSLEELRGKPAIGMTINSTDLKVIQDDLVLVVEKIAKENVNFSGESSDEELGSVSPVDDLSARSGGEAQTLLMPHIMYNFCSTR